MAFDLNPGQSALFGSLSAGVADWAALNTTVGGRLHFGKPWAAPCFSQYNGDKVEPNESECAFVQQNFFNSHLNRSYAFGGYGATQFEGCMSTGDSCLLDFMNAGNPAAFASEQQCAQGSVPPFYIDVKHEKDVAAAFEFSKKQGVPLVIKNTGHDFKGRSSAPDSLALWMHNLKYFMHDANFVPEGCKVEGKSALTVGAGVQFQELFQFADAHGLQVGGGHSPLSPAYGLAVDRTLQYKVVTPDGVTRIANACQNEDLFFALRGGGGGTFGVVMEVTMLTSPRQSFRMANINWPAYNEHLKTVLDIYLNNVTTMAKEGWGGYLTPTLGNLILITPTQDLEAAQELMKPLVDFTTSVGGKSSVTEVSSMLEWFNGWVAGTAGTQDAVGLPTALTSRLVPAKNHETESGRAELRDALMSSFANSIFPQIHMTTPYGFSGTNVRETSVNPIWRSVLYQVIWVNSWFWDSPLADREMAYAQSTKAANFLRDITPEGGAYVNEADIHEPDHEASFWGEHYPRLLEIKKKYDPEHLLDCWHCVGWKGARDPQYKCYI
ncbi:hypothetical protein GALMADRAFT_630927 [Galerina marginata CBS 339.88]|uniref:FAD-binding PCMH-type domain-containing protein n=1 Tax=Galerina marginata (strain CBS 339.88) TaxID=685588 RepID=A0A067SUJ4_GALM3|nr:hypothetical protein GALMADRAFT_630927 [Galerina marginata CBS 339.88]